MSPHIPWRFQIDGEICIDAWLNGFRFHNSAHRNSLDNWKCDGFRESIDASERLVLSQHKRPRFRGNRSQ